MDLVLFGIQGSGKGTLGKLVSEKYGFSIFETGGELRKIAAEDSELGRKIKGIIDSGHLVSNDTIMELIENYMSKKIDTDSKVLFDGIPRFIEQAHTFDALMKKLNRNFLGIQIDIPETVAVRRLTTRRLCKQCKQIYPADYAGEKCEKCEGELMTRADDNPDSITARLQDYYKETIPVITHYENMGKMVKMDGNKNIDDCKKEIFRIIDQYLKH